jgi:hypothetical protein
MFRAFKTVKTLYHSHSRNFSGCGASSGSCRCLEKLNQIHKEIIYSTTIITLMLSSGLILQGVSNIKN